MSRLGQGQRNGNDFVHPKLSTQDQEVRHNEEESDEESDEESQGANIEEEELDEEETNDEDEMHEAVKTGVQLQSNRLRDEAQAKNEDFLNKLDDNNKMEDKDERNSLDQNSGSKKRRGAKRKPESTSAPRKRPTRTTGMLSEGSGRTCRFFEEVFTMATTDQLDLGKKSEGKLDKNLTVKERLAFNVSLRMFTRSVVIQRRVEDIQLGVENYQKKLIPTSRFRTDQILNEKD
ncbi:hypothetical protein Tco_0956001 [Tanacetum coccineum]|uniref:Uncharacterized protein n=1 Tax=Tanacetum coccineum TaxID=301880 RepID=A0ABQ5E8V1_9ASTR